MAENNENHPSFDLTEVIEQKPFENVAFGKFFEEWCGKNDSIVPKIIERGIWDQNGTEGILKNGKNGKKILYIPSDAQLWDLIPILEVIDKNTFINKPERQHEVSEKMQELLSFLRDTGVYFHSRLEKIEAINTEAYAKNFDKEDTSELEHSENLAKAASKAYSAKEIAWFLSEELYAYGTKFDTGTPPPLDQVESLSPARTLSIDVYVTTGQILNHEEATEFFSFLSEPSQVPEGKREKYRVLQKMLPKTNVLIYASQKSVFDPEKSAVLEDYRSEKVAQFFRVAEKAFALEERDDLTHSSGLRPWKNDTPTHTAFLKKVHDAMAKEIEKPKTELVSSIFRRGMDRLQQQMPFDTLPKWVKDNYLHWSNGETTLRETLQIDRLRAELENIKTSGDSVAISNKEREIADTIQLSVSGYEYDPEIFSPSEILANQKFNCVGFSELGGALMKEAGLHYLVGQVPEHSILFLVTNDGSIEWRDMQNSNKNFQLTDAMISGNHKDGTSITIADIVAFSNHPDQRGLYFDIFDKDYMQHQYVGLFAQEYGQQAQFLNSIGEVLDDQSRPEEAAEAYRQAIALNPSFAYPYINLGNVLLDLKRPKEAEDAYQKAIILDPSDFKPYYNLGEVFRSLNRPEEAEESYRQAIVLNPSYAYAYYKIGITLEVLNHPKKAEEAYHQFISLADKQKDVDLILKAEEAIEELEQVV